jgi:hypothetical protein
MILRSSSLRPSPGCSGNRRRCPWGIAHGETPAALPPFERRRPHFRVGKLLACWLSD